MRTIHRNIASAVILSKDEKILFGMKNPSKGGVYADKWHIPGGGIEEGETLEGGLRREILEEVGIDVNDCGVSLLDNKGNGESEKTLKDTGEVVLCKMSFNVFLVRVTKNSDEISVKPEDDLVKYLWVDKDKVKDLDLTPPSIDLFKRIGWIRGV